MCPGPIFRVYLFRRASPHTNGIRLTSGLGSRATNQTIMSRGSEEDHFDPGLLAKSPDGLEDCPHLRGRRYAESSICVHDGEQSKQSLTNFPPGKKSTRVEKILCRILLTRISHRAALQVYNLLKDFRKWRMSRKQCRPWLVLVRP